MSITWSIGADKISEFLNAMHLLAWWFVQDYCFYIVTLLPYGLWLLFIHEFISLFIDIIIMIGTLAICSE